MKTNWFELLLTFKLFYNFFGENELDVYLIKKWQTDLFLKESKLVLNSL